MPQWKLWHYESSAILRFFCTVCKSKLCIIFNPYYINIMIEQFFLELISLLIIKHLIDFHMQKTSFSESWVERRDVLDLINHGLVKVLNAIVIINLHHWSGSALLWIWYRAWIYIGHHCAISNLLSAIYVNFKFILKVFRVRLKQNFMFKMFNMDFSFLQL